MKEVHSEQYEMFPERERIWYDPFLPPQRKTKYRARTLWLVLIGIALVLGLVGALSAKSKAQEHIVLQEALFCTKKEMILEIVRGTNDEAAVKQIRAKYGQNSCFYATDTRVFGFTDETRLTKNGLIEIYLLMSQKHGIGYTFRHLADTI